MFRLRTFGGLWLERDHQRIAGVSSRRLGLLAAVVAAGDIGISRDRLLLLLWPDSTESKARHALAQILYSLRRDLGSDLIKSEPVELLVDRSLMTSDLTDFLDASARGEFERAAAVYSGPFLDGFYVSEADEFERWAEMERSRLREMAVRALESAARQAAAANRTEDALGLWRRVCLIAPHNSRLALGYMTSLAESGDVAAAIQYGRSHELARRKEVGAQADPVVTALLTRLSSGEWTSARSPLATEPRAPEAAAPDAAAAPAAGPKPRAGEPHATGSVRRWVAAAALTATAALGFWLIPPLLSGRTAFPVGSVVVMADPVDLSGDPGLGRALGSAAIVGLQQSRHLTLLSRPRIAEALRRMGRTGDSVLTDSLALDVAAREGARAMFSLTVAQVSGKYSLTGRLVSPLDGTDIASDRVQVDRLDRVIDGLDHLIRKLLASTGDSRSYRDSLPPLPSVTTRSIEALKLYAEAGESQRRLRYDQALQLFARAVEVDSSFALAHAALGSWHYFSNDRPSGDLHYAAALRFRNRLTFREQLTLDGRLAAARGDLAEANRLAKVLAERFPSSETWYTFGTGLMREGQCDEAIQALQRALSFDSTNANTHINIATCYGILGENRLALDAYAAAERADSTALVTLNFNHEWGGVLVRLGRYAEAEAGFGRMLARPSGSDQARGHRSLAYLDMLRGRYQSAIGHLTAATELSRVPGSATSLLRNESLLAEALLMRGEPALASRELDQALKIAETQYVEPGFLALLGRVLVRAGRIRDARAVLSRIDRAMKPDNPTDRSARGLMAAELALERGDPKAAYEAIRTDTDQALERWRWAILGRTLEKRGLLDSALAVTAGFSRSFGFGWDNQTDWVMAPLAVARIAEAMADSATARAALQSFLDRWRDADSDLRVLADVRLAIARLQTGANR